MADNDNDSGSALESAPDDSEACNALGVSDELIQGTPSSTPP